MNSLEIPNAQHCQRLFSNNVAVHKALFKIIPTDNTLCFVSIIKACVEAFCGRYVRDGACRIRM